MITSDEMAVVDANSEALGVPREPKRVTLSHSSVAAATTAATLSSPRAFSARAT